MSQAAITVDRVAPAVPVAPRALKQGECMFRSTVLRAGFAFHTAPGNPDRWLWSSPRGGLDGYFEGEQDAIESAWRELARETRLELGLTALDWLALSIAEQHALITDTFGQQ